MTNTSRTPSPGVPLRASDTDAALRFWRVLVFKGYWRAFACSKGGRVFLSEPLGPPRSSPREAALDDARASGLDEWAS